MSIIALDVGLKRIGVAILLSGVIIPCEPIFRKNRNQAKREIVDFLMQKRCTKLAVGLPNDEIMQKRIKYFINLLNINYPILWINEDNTSLEAIESIKYLKKKSKLEALKNGKVDSLSACKILERILQETTDFNK